MNPECRPQFEAEIRIIDRWKDKDRYIWKFGLMFVLQSQGFFRHIIIERRNIEKWKQDSLTNNIQVQNLIASTRWGIINSYNNLYIKSLDIGKIKQYLREGYETVKIYCCRRFLCV